METQWCAGKSCAIPRKQSMMRLTRVMLNLSFCYSIVKAQSSGKSKAARANAPSRLRQSMATAGSELRIDWVKIQRFAVASTWSLCWGWPSVSDKWSETDNLLGFVKTPKRRQSYKLSTEKIIEFCEFRPITAIRSFAKYPSFFQCQRRSFTSWSKAEAGSRSIMHQRRPQRKHSYCYDAASQLVLVWTKFRKRTSGIFRWWTLCEVISCISSWKACGRQVESMRKASRKHAEGKWKACGRQVESMRKASGQQAEVRWKACGRLF